MHDATGSTDRDTLTRPSSRPGPTPELVAALRRWSLFQSSLGEAVHALEYHEKEARHHAREEVTWAAIRADAASRFDRADQKAGTLLTASGPVEAFGYRWKAIDMPQIGQVVVREPIHGAKAVEAPTCGHASCDVEDEVIEGDPD